MTKWTSEAEAREEIKALVAEYYHCLLYTSRCV